MSTPAQQSKVSPKDSHEVGIQEESVLGRSPNRETSMSKTIETEGSDAPPHCQCEDEPTVLIPHVNILGEPCYKRYQPRRGHIPSSELLNALEAVPPDTSAVGSLMRSRMIGVARQLAEKYKMSTPAQQSKVSPKDSHEVGIQMEQRVFDGKKSLIAEAERLRAENAELKDFEECIYHYMHANHEILHCHRCTRVAVKIDGWVPPEQEDKG